MSSKWTLWRRNGGLWDWLRESPSIESLKAYARDIRRYNPDTRFAICDPRGRTWATSEPSTAWRMKWKPAAQDDGMHDTNVPPA